MITSEMAEYIANRVDPLPEENDPDRELTYGEKLVWLTFNPGQSEQVHGCKVSFAAIIDNLNNLRTISESSEVKRMYSIAITEVQSAQMWSVKAITWQD